MKNHKLRGAQDAMQEEYNDGSTTSRNVAAAASDPSNGSQRQGGGKTAETALAMNTTRRAGQKFGGSYAENAPRHD